MKCICIKSCQYYHIDDSKTQSENGGFFEYKVGNEYLLTKEISSWGNYYKVIHSDNKFICFWESTENNKGIKLTVPEKTFDKFFIIKL